MRGYPMIGTGPAIGFGLVFLLAHGTSTNAQGRGGLTVADAKPGDVRVMVTAAIRTPLEAVRAEALLPDVNEELAKQGQIVAGSFDIARVDVAVGQRGNAPRIEMSTPAALKSAMLNAKSLRWSPTGAALLTVNRILDSLGIRETVKAKHNMPAPVALGPGEYELNIFPLSEILDNKALQNLGPVIPELQVPALITAAIGRNASDVNSAKALIKFLQGPAIEPALKASGMRR